MTKALNQTSANAALLFPSVVELHFSRERRRKNPINERDAFEVVLHSVESASYQAVLTFKVHQTTAQVAATGGVDRSVSGALKSLLDMLSSNVTKRLSNEDGIAKGMKWINSSVH